MFASKVPLPANCTYNRLPFMIIVNPNPQLFSLNLPLFKDVFTQSRSPFVQAQLLAKYKVGALIAPAPQGSRGLVSRMYGEVKDCFKMF
jgi:hypothetical protein